MGAAMTTMQATRATRIRLSLPPPTGNLRKLRCLPRGQTVASWSPPRAGRTTHRRRNGRRSIPQHAAIVTWSISRMNWIAVTVARHVAFGAPRACSRIDCTMVLIAFRRHEPAKARNLVFTHHRLNRGGIEFQIVGTLPQDSGQARKRNAGGLGLPCQDCRDSRVKAQRSWARQHHDA
jgi:hypothetical protein